MRLHVLLIASTLALSAYARASCGVIEVAKGDIRIDAGAKGQAKAAPQGAKLCSGDAIVTGADSRAKVVMEDGNILNVSPDTRLVVENYQYSAANNKKKVLLNILQGKVRATTKKENMYNDKSKDGQANTFEVRTKSAVAGVRGTDFLTSYDSNTQKTEVVTFRGKVNVGAVGPTGVIMSTTAVVAGQRVEVISGRTPETPKAIPAAELSKVNTETKAETAPTPPAAASPAPAATPAPKGASNNDDRGRERAPATAAPVASAPSNPAPAPVPAPNAVPAANNSMMPTANLAPPTVSLGTPPTSEIVVAPKLPAVVQVPPLLQQVNDTIQARAAKVNITINKKN